MLHVRACYHLCRIYDFDRYMSFWYLFKLILSFQQTNQTHVHVHTYHFNFLLLTRNPSYQLFRVFTGFSFTRFFLIQNYFCLGLSLSTELDEPRSIQLRRFRVFFLKFEFIEIIMYLIRTESESILTSRNVCTLVFDHHLI